MINLKLATALILASTLAACGGGSSPPTVTQTPTPPSAPPPPPPEPTPNHDTEEYRLSPGLSEINAIAAYDQGYTGKDITIALLDSGIDDQHPDLVNQIHPASRDFGGNDGALFDDTKYDLSENGAIITPVIHGTLSAGIMVAEKNHLGTHGVAPDAQVLALRMDLSEIADWGGKDLNQAAVPEAIDHAIANNAKVLMVEWAFWDETSNQYAGPDNQIVPEFYIDEDKIQSIKDAFQRAIDANMLIVIPSGNEYGTAPTSFIAQMGLDDANKNGLLIVGGTDREQVIYDRSNKAGYAADYYVVAPTRVVTTSPSRGIGEGRPLWNNSSNGTSFAGPHVAGAAALLMEAFPNLTAKEVAEILLTTATDLGTQGSDEIYGQGLINLEAALQPIGQTASRTRASGSPMSLADSASILSPAFGDALENIKGTSNVLMVDSYNRAYSFDLSQTIQIRPSSPALENRLDTVANFGSSHLSIDNIGNIGFSYISPSKRNAHLSDVLPFAMQTSNGVIENMRFNFSRPISQNTKINVASGDGGSGMFTNNSLSEQHQSIQHNSPMKDPFSALFTDSRSFAFEHFHNENLSYGVGMSQYEQDSSMALFVEKRAELGATAVAVNAHVAWQTNNWETGIDFGALKEKNSFLGSISSGALSTGDNSNTTYSTIHAGRFLANGWRISGRYTFGLSEVAPSFNSFIENITTIRTTAFMVQLNKQQLLAENDMLSFTVSQPLKAVSGDITAYLPTSQNVETGDLVYEKVISSLAPHHRETNLEFSYTITVPQSGFKLQMNMLYQDNPGNRKGNATAFLLQSSLPF